MSLSDYQHIFIYNVAKLIIFAETQDIKLTGGELYRTKYQQEEYLRTGKSKTMKSKHLKRLAIDLNIFIDGKLTYNKEQISVLGEYWELLNEHNRSGMNFKYFYDPCHFEMNI